jgi:hypothetical protein
VGSLLGGGGAAAGPVHQQGAAAAQVLLSSAHCAAQPACKHYVFKTAVGQLNLLPTGSEFRTGLLASDKDAGDAPA